MEQPPRLGKDKLQGLRNVRLGIFGGPIALPTIALHGLGVDDALNLLERKLNRAKRVGRNQIKILHEKDSEKLRRALLDFLSQSALVGEFEEDQNNPSAILVSLA